MISWKLPRRYVFIAILAGIAAPLTAHAEITQLQKLDFGEWAVTDNRSTHKIILNTDGSYTASSNSMVMLSPPKNGVYEVTELPAYNTINSVNVTVIQPMQGTGGMFLIDDFTTLTPAADEDGVTTITLGATASTTGDGQGYNDDDYTGELQIEIHL